MTSLSRRERVQRLLDAVEEMIRPEQAPEAETLERVLRAGRFEPGEGDVEPLLAQPRNRGGEHLRRCEIDLDDIRRFDHQQLDVLMRVDQLLQRLIEIISVEERERRLEPDD